MLTADLRVNGTLIDHVYIVNEGPVRGGKIRYRYEVHEVDHATWLGTVEHSRGDSALVLLAKVLEDAMAQQSGVTATAQETP